MNRLALRMLLGDHAKYLMLVSGITFATILMAQGAALFLGLMSWTFAPLRNIHAPVWVADPLVEQVNDNKPLRDTDVNRVRSVDGVAWAVPLYQGTTQARLFNGTSKLITLTGLDATTLIGAPTVLLKGRLEDLRLPHTVIVDEYAVEVLGEVLGRPLVVGDTFEINDHEARVVGICEAHRAFTGGAFVYTTYERAVSEYVPPQRKLLSFVLAGPAPGVSATDIAARIRAETGLGAFTTGELQWSTVWWYVHNTGIPINVGTIVMIGFLIGTAISGQTFYSFVLENIRNLGALKAMGTSTATLCRMLVLQSFAVGLMGYGIGMGVVALLGRGALHLGKVPFLLTWHIPAGVLCAVLFICALASLIGILKVGRLEPAIVFRS
ncbi:MAG: ABC transporter permease [Burkholderiales bacterium]|nr:ABC transporter permease [Opitutaceae bacterium]